MTALRAGDEFPKGIHFSWVPYTEEKETITSCGIPQTYNASKKFADRKVVLCAVPGAFTPGYSVRHLPDYIEHLKDIKGRGVDIVLVVAMNDAWIMSAWGKANGVKNDQIRFEEHRLDTWGRQDWEICNGNRSREDRICRERAWRGFYGVWRRGHAFKALKRTAAEAGR
ncbi:hypothetical protein HO173_008609 [Letharia columbiana]|uniref:Redoxin domain-containing protein n=1 Tax=Letharia columbiana TaxID=112416 RepID=A0A8H6L2F7_9LECA|nr:uncharacterized protein HO173_008609 [Letharia columbiana]KAF6233065.1 hypothetical protein HO173_008609 [Letharia columbiana]